MREKEREENASDRDRAMRGGLRRGGRASGWGGMGVRIAGRR